MLSLRVIPLLADIVVLHGPSCHAGCVQCEASHIWDLCSLICEGHHFVWPVQVLLWLYCIVVYFIEPISEHELSMNCQYKGLCWNECYCLLIIFYIWKSHNENYLACKVSPPDNECFMHFFNMGKQMMLYVLQSQLATHYCHPLESWHVPWLRLHTIHLDGYSHLIDGQMIGMVHLSTVHQV